MNSEPIEKRTESDCMGSIEIPAHCYWGARTARAQEKLFRCAIAFHPTFLESTILVKKVAALVNCELEQLELPVCNAIVQACDEVLAGKWRDQFIVEPFQSGAGAVFNTNVNEVLANRAEEILGGSLGEYKLVDPEKHANLSQSATDVFPTAMRITLLKHLIALEPVMLDLERLLRRKALKFAKTLKIGRSHLIDSEPITLGQEFSGFASRVEHSLKEIKEASNRLLELNLGAGRVGTGFNIHPAFSQRAANKLAFFTNLALRPGNDFLRLSQSMSDFLPISSALKEFAIELNQISNDLRLLNSGPRTGLSEIKLSSFNTAPFPLAVNRLSDQTMPHLAESLNMVCYQVLGNDLAVTMAAQAGQLEANIMTPLIIHNLLQSLSLLTKVTSQFTKNCLNDIDINREKCEEYFTESGFLLVALSEQIGQTACQSLLDQYSGDAIKLCQALISGELISKEILAKILPHSYLTSAGIRPQTKKLDES